MLQQTLANKTYFYKVLRAMQGLSHYRPGQARRGCLKVEAPRISRRYMKEARLSALCTGRLYRPGGTPDTPRATVGPEV